MFVPTIEQQVQETERLRREVDHLLHQVQFGSPHGHGPAMLYGPRQPSNIVPFGKVGAGMTASAGGFVPFVSSAGAPQRRR